MARFDHALLLCNKAAEICKVLLERWRQQRGFTDPYSGNQKLQVLRPLAAWMMDHQTKEIATKTLLEVIADPLSRIGVASGQEPAVAFLRQLQEGSGLLLERELDTWGFAHLSFQEYLCAEEWASQPASAPCDWDSRVTESWWREALLLYASRAADASPLVTAALNQGSPQALALVMLLHGEKLNLDVETRERVERAVVAALASRDEETFQPAGEAWLHRQQEANYHLLNETTEISGWVTQAEFQTFLRSDHGTLIPFGHVPANWNQGWLEEAPKDPVLGVSSRMASTYVQWLNERFPTFEHRLPRPAECENEPTWLTWCSDGVRDSLHGECPPETVAKLAAWLHARPELGGKACAWDFKLALDLDLPRSFDRDLNPALNRRLNTTLVRALVRDLDPYLTRGIARDLNLALNLDFDLALDLALALGFALDFGVIRAHAIDFSRSIASGLALAFDYRNEKGFHEFHREVNDWMRQPGVPRRRARCLLPLFAVLEADTTFTKVVDAYRRFWVACFDAIREHDPRLITPLIAEIERSMRVLVARTDGELPAWEGLRVVRERRL